jgi:hypothetical protein
MRNAKLLLGPSPSSEWAHCRFSPVAVARVDGLRERLVEQPLH